MTPLTDFPKIISFPSLIRQQAIVPFEKPKKIHWRGKISRSIYKPSLVRQQAIIWLGEENGQSSQPNKTKN